MNGATFAAGLVDQAFALNGSGQYADMGNDPSLQVSSGDFTVDTWVNFNSISGDQPIVDKIYPPAGVNVDGWRLLKQADNRLWFCLGGGDGNHCGASAFTVFSSTVATTGTWYHVAAVRLPAALRSTSTVWRKTRGRRFPPFSTAIRATFSSAALCQTEVYLDGLCDEVELFNQRASLRRRSRTSTMPAPPASASHRPQRRKTRPPQPSHRRPRRH